MGLPGEPTGAEGMGAELGLLQALERGELGDPLALSAYLAGQHVELPAAEAKAARRRALLLLAAGGGLRREPGIDERAVKALAADLRTEERVRQLAAGLDELARIARDLPRAREAVLYLIRDLGARLASLRARAPRRGARRRKRPIATRAPAARPGGRRREVRTACRGRRVDARLGFAGGRGSPTLALSPLAGRGLGRRRRVGGAPLRTDRLLARLRLAQAGARLDSLGRSASLFEVLHAAETWAVSILAADQVHLAQHFARSVPPLVQWDGIPVHPRNRGSSSMPPAGSSPARSSAIPPVTT